ncbi:SpoIIE family protein phosphatase [bacterium]|nr:SpoIIE family protein phosphatase [bacterium]
MEGDWQDRLSHIVATMREMSLQTDPQVMVKVYGQRMQELMPVDRRLSLSRRGLTEPQYRITRFSGWLDEINPWKEEERLPLLSGGLLAELIYSDEPRIINDLDLDPADPAHEYLQGQHSLLALPLYDQGVAMNMVVVTRKERGAFRPEELPERVWMSNLFGRATQNLVLAEHLDQAYRDVDRELKAVADIQRSLLPAQLPHILTMKLATHYQTSQRAGGDYYDFFPLKNGRWGILIADVSGHGTPAAVMMAITHCIAHMHHGAAEHPSDLLRFLNDHLTARYTGVSGHFVTAFYAIYDPRTRRLMYASAGHNPPRLRRCGTRSIVPLNRANYLPLGIAPQLEYRDGEIDLQSGDRLVLYTDGITEAARGGELFGVERLDDLISDCGREPSATLGRVLEAIEEFTQGDPPSDDRTLVIADIL